MFIAKEHKWLRAPAERHVLCGFELHAAPPERVIREIGAIKHVAPPEQRTWM